MQQIAFYAPLKSPRHKNPSGDRQIARLLQHALQLAGFDVQLASQLRSFDKAGDSQRQQRMIALADKLANRIIKHWQRKGYRPDAWFTYHLYYKAPDLLGPKICKTLSIPYIACEASWAAKRANGPWQAYHQQLDIALSTACKVCTINPVDQIALNDYYTTQAPSPLHRLAPFVETPATEQVKDKTQLAHTYRLDVSKPWLITVAMMRDGDKYKSYELLAETLQLIQADFQLLIIGDGKRQEDVKKLFSGDHRVRFAGRIDNEALLQLLPHFSINLWPAVNEALGMTFLESQARGCTVVAGNEGGVHSVVDNGHTGILCPPRDSLALARAVDSLLSHPEQLENYQQNARTYVTENHSLQHAATELRDIISHAITIQKQSNPTESAGNPDHG
ncbi:glycosyltransferase family 4 protein [Aliamphritea spongicola]|uniref:glycosyltransferase family 4 protein n=1 Tax=Aliamphritea spongicola TaxID=707589 RepID=UPI00196AB61C|nr:glycosyltransferase family 4 protein [Aliamphritea spongicola]MBN3563566.1 glycosyltransferase family 4 protein [Aliamphritea spongicola]